MNIAIIEKGHFEVAYTLISLFDTGGNKITIFADEPSYNQLTFLLQDKSLRYTWIIQRSESNRSFIQSIFAHTGSHHFDLIYFNTIADNFIRYAWHIKNLEPVKVIMTLHDINGFFQYTFSWSIRGLIRYIGKRRLIRLVPCFNVLSETLIAHLRQKLPATKKIVNIPGSFFNPGNFAGKEFHKNDSIKITIPGSVDIRRRDYGLAFDLLELAEKHSVSISITFLGSFRKNYSETIYAQYRLYSQVNNNLHIYQTGIVDQAEFDRVMNESHFIWMPLQPSAIVTDGTTEIYGTSISSGNIGDAIRYARPFFAPQHFILDNALQKNCCRYENITDIINLLVRLDEKTYQALLVEAVSASMNYTKEKIIEKNASLFY
ncbi:MAG: hypothetical protein JWM28_860 [Chitinophagaceae bacterium]|nr:hypothetical protein [Chitinophagaceae bacterium]